MLFFQRWSLRNLLRRHGIDDSLWRETVDSVYLIRELAPTERARLRVFTTRFLREKTFTGAAGLQPTSQMQVMVAAQACLLILKLRWRRFGGWREVVLYPGGFRVRREIMDETGVMHHGQQELRGEAWQRGVVVLSWEDVLQDAKDPQNGGEWYPGNVVLHEFAHKLDMLSGHANGMPPLHPNMPPGDWTATLSQAYAQLQQRRNSGQPSAIDPYGATDPAEFFAVLTEVFFVQPQVLAETFPQAYTQLRRFYRQHPLRRRSKPGSFENR